ncbi:MAG TPA: sigma-70 family RNA polymerase sigma factor [Acidimicrobiia bacterium]
MLRDDTGADTFTELVRRLEPRLRRALTAAFGSDIGREAAAEALAYGWQHWSKVGGMDNPSGYLFRVGQNKARHMTRLSRRWSHDQMHFEEPWAEPRFGPAWSSLSERQRVAVGLIHGFDWTLSEVADFLGVSKGTVQTYEKRALRKLRRELGVDS